MENNEFDKIKLINYWIESSNDDFDTMIVMFENKRYSWSMFIGHLLIEKFLKALFVKVNETYPPLIHNLLRLAEKSNIALDDESRMFYATVTAFNINARYDDYKMTFQKTCTVEFSTLWLEKIKNQRLWIIELIKQ